MVRPAIIAAAAVTFAASAGRAQDGYVGTEVCLGCHEDVVEAFQHTIHSKVFREGNARSERMRRGCEACHGPGEAHVAGGGGKAGSEDWVSFRGGPEQVPAQNASCMGCHRGGDRLYWDGSPHESRGNACTDCHNVHAKVSSVGQLKHATQSEVCSQCHLVSRSQTWRNAHHPQREGPASRASDLGREGWMQCTSCHNPHGTVTEHLIDATSVNDKCYGCHAEKRGPFLWEHAPVQEDCTSCHDPHGSIHPSMLVVAPPRLCQSCHNPTLHPSEARTRSSRFIIQDSCLNCHRNVHGSNHPSGMFFTR